MLIPKVNFTGFKRIVADVHEAIAFAAAHFRDRYLPLKLSPAAA